MSFHDFSSNPYKNIAEEPGYVHTLYFEYLAKKVILLKSYTKVHNQREKKAKLFVAMVKLGICCHNHP